jgi:hypothetical protein
VTLLIVCTVVNAAIPVIATAVMPQQPVTPGQAQPPSPCDVKALNECLQRTNGDMQQVHGILACHVFLCSNFQVHCYPNR